MPAALSDAQRSLLLATARAEVAQLCQRIDSANPHEPGLAEVRQRRKYVRNQIYRWEHPELTREQVKAAQVRYRTRHNALGFKAKQERMPMAARPAPTEMCPRCKAKLVRSYDTAFCSRFCGYSDMGRAS
jgi:hypothetical protein